ncbi:hypothetical protein N781_13295 [Pontibacillus halophilus JSM 076056 = DSM 19796]|uniref:VOC domain-containing protein n=1 Tax=Pontibacillus halophilus JSM 076056 = DSM 19796 TaxID=1385510 RepID=A0A0A5IB43_9BACI|nr:glyoxalase/bleomycin resistance/dioxygenase family protein [Pontibacillus halophilus]KGX93042.1 hypothetical protein N781_13295 [Pontibacillus halophilus JSM 076056 = DSM 19796]
MKVLGYRHVTISDQSNEMVDFFENKLGLTNEWDNREGYEGGIFKSGNSWLEYWQSGKALSPTIMLQLVVDDADEFAQFAKHRELDLHGPIVEHGEKIYSLTAPNGMPMTIQSTIKG